MTHEQIDQQKWQFTQLVEKAKALYESVFDQRKDLIREQPEYFYRAYIDFIIHHRFDLMSAIRCLVDYRDEFKDGFIYMALEMTLNFVELDL